MVVQGVDLAARADDVKLPSDFQLIEVPGALPEARHKDGRAFLIGEDGKLYPRVVNKGPHVAIETRALPKPRKTAHKAKKN